jgi:hypothetical protein
MSNTKILTNFIIAVILIAAVIFGYFYYFTDDSTDSTSLTTVSSVDEDSEFASLLRSARNVELKMDLFSGGGFSPQLADYSVVLPDKPKGRSNPFAVPGTATMTTATEDEVEDEEKVEDDE